VKATTGNPSETAVQVNAARASVSNATDLVNSPIAATCYSRHATVTAASHMAQNGGDIDKVRTEALLELPWDMTPAL
jgi:hypothetical protein